MTKEINVQQVKHCCDCGQIFDEIEIVKDTDWLKDMKEEEVAVVYDKRTDKYYWTDDSELCYDCELTVDNDEEVEDD